jgi:DNA helicase HerA-like ATPase
VTGSGKTGLVTVLTEEALRAGVPVLVIDVKGDLPNLLLAFPARLAFGRHWTNP